MNESQPRSENLTGIFLMLASMALFAVEDLFLKLAAADLPIGQIILISGALGMPVFVGMAWRQGKRILVKEALQPAVIARNIGEVVAAASYVAALAAVPLGTVASVLQALPLFMTMGAALFLGEAVGWRRWTAILVGFVGVLLVIQPGAGGFRIETLLMLVSVAGDGGARPGLARDSERGNDTADFRMGAFVRDAFGHRVDFNFRAMCSRWSQAPQTLIHCCRGGCVRLWRAIGP
jgi:drug/metabolite transporter (DMT)-like permease